MEVLPFPSFLYVSLGVIIHQLVDLMWKRPVNWFYPFPGRYQVEVHQNYVAQMIITELPSCTEWIFFIAILVIILIAGIRIYQKKPVVSLDPLQEQRQHQLYAGLLGIAIFVLILSIAIIYIWQPYQAMIL